MIESDGMGPLFEARVYWGFISRASCSCSNPAHPATGSRGYFGKRLSSADRRQRINTEPRSETIRRMWRQVAHSPTAGRSPDPWCSPNTYQEYPVRGAGL